MVQPPKPESVLCVDRATCQVGNCQQALLCIASGSWEGFLSLQVTVIFFQWIFLTADFPIRVWKQRGSTRSPQVRANTLRCQPSASICI